MSAFLDRCWRRIATVLCFAVFGLSAVLFGLVLAPLTRLFVHPAARRRLFLRRTLAAAMRAFITLMRSLRVLEVHYRGHVPAQLAGTLVIANHPTLIDALLLFAYLPPVSCVAKPSLQRSLVLGPAVNALGYISYDGTASKLIGESERKLFQGESMLFFPEGTRTRTGAPITLQRASAYLAIRTGCPVLPVTIAVSEPLLTKELAWWAVPSRRPVFIVQIHPIEDVRSAVGEESNANLAARSLSRRWEAFFAKEVQGA